MRRRKSVSKKTRSRVSKSKMHVKSKAGVARKSKRKAKPKRR